MQGKTSYILIALAFLFYANFYPFWVEQWVFTPSFISGAIFALIWGVALLLFGRRLIFPGREFNICTFILLSFILVHWAVYDDISDRSTLINIIFGWIGIVFLQSSMSIDTFLKCINKWQVVMLFSIFVGLILYVSGVLHPLSSIIFNETTTHTYTVTTFGFFNTKLSNYSDESFVRCAGWYDEPGSLINMLVLLLLLNLRYIKSSKLENLYLCGGFIALSAAHYIIAFFYFIFFKIETSFSSVFKVLLVVGTFTALIYVLPNTGAGAYIKDASINRVTKMYNEGGDDRDYNTAYKAFEDYMWSGASTEMISKNHPGATPETIFYVMAKYGIFGTFIFFIYIIYGLYRNRKSIDFWKWSVIFALLLSQRPNYLFETYILLIYLLFYIDDKEETLNES